MQPVALIQHLVEVVRKFLVGVVEMTRKVLMGFVAAVMAGLGIGMVLGTLVALMAALAISGVRVRGDETGPGTDDFTVIDITPALA